MVVFVFSKKDFKLIFEFMQLREAFASGQPMDFGIKQTSHMLCSHFLAKSWKSQRFFALEVESLMLEGMCVVNSAKTSHEAIRSSPV